MNLGKHLGAIPAQDNKQFVMCVVLGRSGNSKENLFFYDNFILTRQQYKMQNANFRPDTKCRLHTRYKVETDGNYNSVFRQI